MPQLTLSVPTEKLPALQKFLHDLGIFYVDENTVFETQGAFPRQEKTRQTFPESSRQSFFEWDNYSCQLEFE